jgi:dimethylaniline monooxygenase (N-oxide forming)
MKIAIIGSGVSGVAAAKALGRLGHELTLFEKSDRVGGVWAVAYPGVHLQIMSELYCYPDFPWPFEHDDYPSAEEVLRYIHAAMTHFGIKAELNSEVRKLTPDGDGWLVEVATPDGLQTKQFEAVIVATGNYTGEKAEIGIEGRDKFKGEVLAPNDIGDYASLKGKRVAVVGFGKSAIDMLHFSLGHARELHHVFREARWLLPAALLGMSSSRLSTQRISSAYSPSWVYPDPALKRQIERFPSSVSVNTTISDTLIRLSNGLFGIGKSAAARARLALVNPTYPVHRQLRGTLVPQSYFPAIASGAIEPHRSAVEAFTEEGLRLADGTHLDCDVVVLALGYKPPAMPFLPQEILTEIAAEPDGLQLYRHILHPRMSRLAFIGFSQNPMLIPTSHISSIWFDAVLRGDLELPSPEAMEASSRKVRDWKRANTIFEPSRGYFIGSHLHNYLTVLLSDLGLRTQRKRNKISDMFGTYTAADYATILDEYEGLRGTRRTVLPLDT